RKKECVRRGVIGDVARSGVGTKPFANLSFMEVGLFGELLRGRRAGLSKRGVESKPVAQYNERPVYGGPKVVDHLPKKLIKGIGVHGCFAARRHVTSSGRFHSGFLSLR